MPSICMTSFCFYHSRKTFFLQPQHAILKKAVRKLLASCNIQASCNTKKHYPKFSRIVPIFNSYLILGGNPTFFCTFSYFLDALRRLWYNTVENCAVAFSDVTEGLVTSPGSTFSFLFWLLPECPYDFHPFSSFGTPPSLPSICMTSFCFYHSRKTFFLQPQHAILKKAVRKLLASCNIKKHYPKFSRIVPIFKSYLILGGKPTFFCTFVSVLSARRLAFSAPLLIIASR